VTDERAVPPWAPVVGMVGAGQLARMTYQASIPLAVGFRVLAAEPGDSAAQVCPGVRLGDYTDLDDLLTFAAGCDVVTFDHEHVPGPLLAALEEAAVVIRPGAGALRFTQDKLAMRERLTALGVPCPRYAPAVVPADVEAFAADSGWPVVLKAVRGGYDGKGVWVCGTLEQAAEVLAHWPVKHGAAEHGAAEHGAAEHGAAEHGAAVIVEEYVGFDRELAALVARSPHNQGAAYPVVQTVQRDGVCREVLAPAPGLSVARAREAERLALELAAKLEVTGLLAVELFETSGGLLVNELAMRPHNSGHWTIEGAGTSQFEQHLRAVLDLPLGDPTAVTTQVVMANVFGGSGLASADPDVYARYTHVMAADPAVKVHLYGKTARPGRKIGHVTVLPNRALGDDIDALRERAGRAARYLGEGKD
jgi:5-(carboxyamino)imidazole ribonucleotide synthase